MNQTQTQSEPSRYGEMLFFECIKNNAERTIKEK